MRALAALACAVAAPGSAQSPPAIKYQPTEVEVKAAFLYHFAQLVTWPDTADADPPPPLVVAILGPDPFGDRLEAIIGDEKIRGRSFKIQRIVTLTELAEPPQILFIGSTDRVETERALAAVAKSPVLTVGVASGFAKRGGMIEFRLTPDRRVAFDINLQAVASAGLKMSSQLLKIARIVEPLR
jgi:YfiR/HmsC-like